MDNSEMNSVEQPAVADTTQQTQSDATAQQEQPTAVDTTQQVRPDATVQPEKAANKPSVIIPIIIGGVAVVAILVSVYFIYRARKITNSFDGEAWYANAKMEEAVIPEVEAFNYKGDVDSSLADSWVQGVTYGSVAADDTYYYCTNSKDKEALYRITKAEPHRSEKLSDIMGSTIVAKDEKLYLINKEVNGDFAPGIYSVNKDGSDLQLLLCGYYSDINVINDWIYYVRTSDNRLCKIHEFNRREIVVIDEYIEVYQLDKNNIVCVIKNEAEETYSLFKYDVDGAFISEYPSISGNNFSMSNGILYGYESDNGFYSFNYDEYDKGNSEVQEKYFHLEGCYFWEVADNKIYFIDTRSIYRIGVIDIDTGEMRYYSLEQVSSFVVFDNMLLIEYMKDGVNPMFTVVDKETGSYVPLFE